MYSMAWLTQSLANFLIVWSVIWGVDWDQAPLSGVLGDLFD